MNLLTRGIPLSIEEQCCVFCNSYPENEEHLFLSCQMIYALWSKVYGWLDIAGVQPLNIHHHFQQHRGLFKGKTRKARGMIIWIAVIWTILLQRNDIIFNDKRPDLIRMIDLIKCRSWSWFNSTVDGCIMFPDWCESPLEFSHLKLAAAKLITGFAAHWQGGTFSLMQGMLHGCVI